MLECLLHIKWQLIKIPKCEEFQALTNQIHSISRRYWNEPNMKINSDCYRSILRILIWYAVHLIEIRFESYSEPNIWWCIDGNHISKRIFWFQMHHISRRILFCNEISISHFIMSVFDSPPINNPTGFLSCFVWKRCTLLSHSTNYNHICWRIHRSHR